MFASNGDTVLDVHEVTSVEPVLADVDSVSGEMAVVKDLAEVIVWSLMVVESVIL